MRRSQLGTRRVVHTSAGEVTVYCELLRLALAQGEDTGAPVAELVTKAVALRGALDAATDPSSRIGDAIAYDVALIRICDHLGVRNDLRGELAGPEARRRAETRLVEHLPSLGAAFDLDAPR